MSELINIKQAVLRTGRSERTIRRWLANGKLEPHEQKGKRKKILVDAQALVMVAAEMMPLKKKDTVKHDTKGVTEALRDHLHDTRRQRDAFEFELKQCRQQLDELSGTLSQKQERIAALEKVINGGVRGLLRRINPLR